MRAVEAVQHRLSLVVRVDDHFSGAPWPAEVDVTLTPPQAAVTRSDRGGFRHEDGTYRFVGLVAGARQITVASKDGAGFTWDASTPVVLPLANAAAPVVIEMWPSPKAAVAPGVIAIRGKLAPALADREVRMQVVGVAPARIRRSRTNAAGEFTFVVTGPVALSAPGLVSLDASVPGKTVSSSQLMDGNTNPITPGSVFTVTPNREIRVRFNLT